MVGRGIRAKLFCVAVLVAMGMAVRVWAEDPGELFPNLKSYEQDVPEPVKKPEKALADSKLRPSSQATPSQPAESKTKGSPGPVDTQAAPSVATAPAGVSWAPYRDRLIAPLMSPESQSRFDREYAPWFKSTLHMRGANATEAADALWKRGEEQGLPADLKMVLWLHALGLSIRDTKLDASAAKARAVLPMLQTQTLAVAQARVDAVTGLAFGALSKASDDLLNLAFESECQLARMQVQCGFPEEANANAELARDIFGYLKHKTNQQREMLAEEQAWVGRATAAQASSAEWRELLKQQPDDVVVNTQMAILNLSLFGDVKKAANYASKSTRTDLKNLAAVMEKVGGRGPETTVNPAGTEALAEALLTVAKESSAQRFDEYSIALLVREKLAELTAQGDLPANLADQAHELQSKAALLVTKSGYRPPVFEALAALRNDTDAGGASKLQLFVKDNGTLVKYVKPTAAEDAQAMRLIRAFAKDVSEKSGQKYVEVETDHCLVFTDWPVNQRGFLKKNVEGAYVMLAKAFDYPLKQNVFPGKLPVFMLTSQQEFLSFFNALGATENMGTSAAVFRSTASGVGYVAMYQPDAKSGAQLALTNWGRALTVTMGYAFEARYRTNKSLPGWLGQGLATCVAYAQLPPPGRKKTVEAFAGSLQSIELPFGNVDNTYDMQCARASIVAMLMSQNKKAFVQLLNKIKDGEDQTAALQETFHCTEADLGRAWKSWVARTGG